MIDWASLARELAVVPEIGEVCGSDKACLALEYSDWDRHAHCKHGERIDAASITSIVVWRAIPLCVSKSSRYRDLSQ